MNLELYIKTLVLQWAKCCFIAVVFLMVSNPAECDQLQFKRITNKEGLSHNWIRCIFQDNNGYMWFGTSGALNRYNGYECKVYNIGNGSINAIAKKDGNELWICTDLGIYTFNTNTEKLTRCNFLKTKAILCVLCENDQCVWFGSNDGYYKYFPKEHRVQSCLLPSNERTFKTNYINTFFKDSKGNVWLGTKSGLQVYNSATKLFVQYQSTTAKNSLANNEVYSIKEDDNHRLWIGTLQGGLDVFPNATSIPQTGNFIHVAEGSVMDICIATNKTLWFATGNGLGAFSLNDFTVDKKPSITYYKNDINNTQSLSENTEYSLFEDNMHDIWVGSIGSGVTVISFRGKQFHVTSSHKESANTMISDLINVLFEDDAYLWIGTEVGLDRYDKRTKIYKHFQHDKNDPSSLKSNAIFAITKDSRGNLWVGTWGGGFDVYDYKTETFKHFSPNETMQSLHDESVFAIVEDHNKNMWIGTVGGGLNRFDYKTQSFTHYVHDKKNPQSIQTNFINSILETKDGHLFVSNNHSLEEFDEKCNGFHHYQIPDSILYNSANNYIISLFEDSKQQLWLATYNGLEYFDRKTKTFTSFSKTKDNIDNTILGIQEDTHKNLWLSTTNGIVKFLDGVDLPTHPEFQRFTKADGIAGNEGKRRSVFKNKDGIIYIGSSQGFTYFNPDSIVLNQHIPTIVITDIKLLSTLRNENVTYKPLPFNPNNTKTISLTYRNSDFVIDFAALNYLNSQNNRYKYKLEGYDSDWIDAGNQTSATYTNIADGQYTFKIIASNNDGVWSKQPKCLDIVITPPWWKTTLFKIFCFLVFVTGLYLFFKIRFARIKEQKELLNTHILSIQYKNAKRGNHS